MHVKLTELPETLRAALTGLGYHGADIAVEARDTYRMNAGGSGQGRRAFVCAVDLATGQKETRTGSWGGANMFSPQNGVDLDSEARPLLPNFAVIYGSEGNQVYAHVAVHPDTLRPLLPATSELSEQEHAVLAMYKGLTSAGRKNQIERWLHSAYASVRRSSGFADAAVLGEEIKASRAAVARCRVVIDALTGMLVAKGLLKTNKAGAISVTTEGKNAVRPHSSTWGKGLDYFPTLPETPAPAALPATEE